MREEKVIENAKRFVPIEQYKKLSGLSYATIDYMCKSGQLRFVTTESGLRRIDTQEEGNTDTSAIIKRLDEAEKMLKALCGHLGVKIN